MCYAVYNEGLCGRQCLNALAVIETPSGEIRLLPGLEYEANLKFFLLFQNGWEKKKQEKAAKIIFQGLPTTLRHLNENSSIAFSDLLNRNTEF